MSVNLKRPILVGGVSLSFALWLLDWHHWSALGEYSIVGAIALGLGLGLFRQYRFKDARKLDNTPLDREKVEKAIAQVETVVSHLETETQNHQLNLERKVGVFLERGFPPLTPNFSRELRQKVAQLHTQLDRQEIHIAVTGGKAVGKTTLIQVLQSKVSPIPTLCWSETLVTDTEAGLKAAQASDLVLFVTNSDLTDSEYQVLQQLAANQRLVLVLNKQDQYLPDDRAAVLHSIQQRMQPLLKTEDVVAIAAKPSPILVRQYQTDDTAQEWMEERSPEITQLTGQLSQIVVKEGQQLVWATTKRAADNLKAEAKTVLNQVRRDRAQPVVEQYQWIAAAAAFANPVPALDLLATAAINAQLVIELGAIYQQKFSLQQAQAVAGTMGNLMLKLGLVELSTKAVSTVLKSNAVTFVAGGVVQGVSAAYLTRLAGFTLIEYLQQQEVDVTATGLNLEKLGQTLQNVFQQNQQLAFVQGFVKQGVKRLTPQAPQPQLNES